VVIVLALRLFTWVALFLRSRSSRSSRWSHSVSSSLASGSAAGGTSAGAQGQLDQVVNTIASATACKASTRRCPRCQRPGHGHLALIALALRHQTAERLRRNPACSRGTTPWKRRSQDEARVVGDVQNSTWNISCGTRRTEVRIRRTEVGRLAVRLVVGESDSPSTIGEVQDGLPMNVTAVGQITSCLRRRHEQVLLAGGPRYGATLTSLSRAGHPVTVSPTMAQEAAGNRVQFVPFLMPVYPVVVSVRVDYV
jgi:hypothetical protein